MPDSLSLLETLREREPRLALATLVATRGSVPRGEGAKMAVGASGRVLGTVTIGGCVDARVLEEAARVLETGEARHVAMALGDDDAAALGLACSGTIELLVEPVDTTRHDDPVMVAARVLAGHADAGREAVSVARLDGARGRLVVGDDGRDAGTLGDAALDAGAAALARECLATATSGRATLRDARGADVPVFAERHATPETLVVFGGGEVAVALVELATLVGWRCVVVDGRDGWATRERFPRAAALHGGMMDDVAAGLRYGPRTAVAMLAHDYRVERPVLRTVLAAGAGYVGLLGGRRRVAALLDLLAEDGVPEEARARLHAPVGLDIGARTPAEIALAVLAEAMAVLRGRSGAPLSARPVSPVAAAATA